MHLNVDKLQQIIAKTRLSFAMLLLVKSEFKKKRRVDSTLLYKRVNVSWMEVLCFPAPYYKETSSGIIIWMNEKKKKEMLREINGLINLQMKKKVVSINLASL